MRVASFVTLAAAFLGGGMALAQASRPPPSPLPSPGVLLGELHAVNLLEVELGTLAQANAGQAEVKKFGQQMVKAHTRMDSQGNEYAKKHQLTVTRPPSDPEHQVEGDANDALKERLRGLKGAQFDRAWRWPTATGRCSTS